MLHSTITTKGQTTIPGQVRAALNLKPGDRLQYELQGDHVTIRVHPGLLSLKGALSSDKAKNLSFKQIRSAAKAVAARRYKDTH